METKRAGWNIDVIGRTGLSLSSGLERLIVMNDTDISMSRAVICLSPYLVPSRYRTDSEYADMRQLRARICACVALNRVGVEFDSAATRTDG